MAKEHVSFHYVGTINVETLNRHGFQDASDEVWISNCTILKILRKHSDLEQIILDDSTLIQSINTLIKNARYFSENFQHDDPSIKLFGEVCDKFVILVLILRKDGNSVSTFHRFRKRKADQLFELGKLKRWN